MNVSGRTGKALFHRCSVNLLLPHLVLIAYQVTVIGQLLQGTYVCKGTVLQANNVAYIMSCLQRTVTGQGMCEFPDRRVVTCFDMYGIPAFVG